MQAAAHTDSRAHDPHHEEPGFWRKYIFSTDHKVIGIQYGFTALCFLLFGFFLMLLMRWQIAHPTQPVPFIGPMLEKMLGPMAAGGAISADLYNAFGAMHGFFPVALFAIGAIRNIPPVLLRTARVMRLSRLDLVRNILLPAALPEIVTGLRIGFSATLLGTLMGELFASSEGLGFLLIRAMDIHNVPDIMALTLLLFLVATAANILILAVERRVHSHGT